MVDPQDFKNTKIPRNDDQETERAPLTRLILIIFLAISGWAMALGYWQMAKWVIARF